MVSLSWSALVACEVEGQALVRLAFARVLRWRRVAAGIERRAVLFDEASDLVDEARG